MRRVVVLGSNGQVGAHIVAQLQNRADTQLFALTRASPLPWTGDLCDFDGLERTMLALRPDVIVNAAAWTAVDAAESEARLAHRVNSEAVELLARLAHQHNALLVSFSTDYVFSGSGQRPWLETDATAPLNVYGRTKAEAERQLERSRARYLMLRTSWIQSERGHNFMRTVLKLAREHEQLRMVCDQVGTPTSAEFVAQQTVRLMDLAMRQSEVHGIYHVVPDGSTSWWEFARWIVGLAQQIQPEGWALAPERIAPITSAQLQRAAVRPLNSRLSNAKLKALWARTEGAVELGCWQSHCAKVLRHILASQRPKSDSPLP